MDRIEVILETFWVDRLGKRRGTLWCISVYSAINIILSMQIELIYIGADKDRR